MKSYNILLTGASGTVGREVLKQISNHPSYNVTVFDVKTKQSELLLKKYSDTIKIVYGDIRNPNDIEKATKEIDVVLHLAAIIPPLADENTKLAREVNVEGTHKLLQSVQKNSPKAFFLYGSSISVYGDRILNPMIQCNDPIHPSENDYYAKTKIEAEELVKNSGLSWSIFRIAAVMGYGNHKLDGIMFEMPLNTSLEIITPADTARAFVHAIEHQELLKNNIYNLGGGEKCRTSYREFLGNAFRIYGLGKLDFPDHAFAERNYHCGYYADGNKLNDILHFQKDTLDLYFQKLKAFIAPVQHAVTFLFKRPIKYFLQKKSLPYKAYKHHDKKLLLRFFPAYE